MVHGKRKIQYLAGICASLGFVFTGAALSWPSPAMPKFKNNETDFRLSDVSRPFNERLSDAIDIVAYKRTHFK
ncbi:hypothetical protein EVAR_7548_1 [Eumeta japonica]|uniref:Uncharacterized protein n=1 Tax=Eumeta variegata TaxID=151549 RepID=A0A4C1VQS4_EUMVA|nr:hypothetical protein EVAR_7548_1 [Eumeta japonica]